MRVGKAKKWQRQWAVVENLSLAIFDASSSMKSKLVIDLRFIKELGDADDAPRGASGAWVLTQKGNEIRSLNIEVKELRRSIDVNRKLAPEISLYDRQIVLHKQQLLEAKQQAVKLEKDLEDPDNAKRWRKLEGKIPDKEELNAKLNQLEDRLNVLALGRVSQLERTQCGCASCTVSRSKTSLSTPR